MLSTAEVQEKTSRELGEDYLDAQVEIHHLQLELEMCTEEAVREEIMRDAREVYAYARSLRREMNRRGKLDRTRLLASAREEGGATVVILEDYRKV